MPIPVESLPAKPLNLEQVTGIVNDVLVVGSYKIKIEEIELASKSSEDELMEVADIKERDRLTSDTLYFITDLVTGRRYNFASNNEENAWGFKKACMYRLRSTGQTNRPGMLLSEEKVDAQWILWHSPVDSLCGLDVGGQLDPLLESIVSRLRK